MRTEFILMSNKTWNLISTSLQSRFLSYSWPIRFHLQYNNCKISVTDKRKGQLIKHKLLASFLQWIGSDYSCFLRYRHEAKQCIPLYRAAQVVKEREGTGLLGQFRGDQGHTLLTPLLLLVLLYCPGQDWGQCTPAHITAEP